MVRFTRRVSRMAGRKGGMRRKINYQIRRIRRKAYGSKVYHFTEPYLCGAGTATPVINVPALGGSGGQLTFNLASLTNINSYKNLFDLFKINKVQVKILPYGNVTENNVVGNGGPNQGALPMLYIAPNRDYWIGSPTSAADVMNDDGVRVIRLDKPVTLTLKAPRPNVLDHDGTTMNYGILPNRIGQWLSTGGNGAKIDQTPTTYYSFRWWCDNYNSTSFTPQVVVKLFFSMKERD